MKKVLIAVTTLAGLAACVGADKCKGSWAYCGHVLHKTDPSYHDMIYQSIFDVTGMNDPPNWENGLFVCRGGPAGVIKYITQCKECVNVPGRDDYCKFVNAVPVVDEHKADRGDAIVFVGKELRV